ncbi:MAG: hypothetical protein R2764_07025 [Bacteroidales bacterium]
MLHKYAVGIERNSAFGISILGTNVARYFWTQHTGKIFDMGKVMNLTAGMLGDLGGIMGNSLIIMFTVIFILFELNAFAVKMIAIADSPEISLNYLTKIGHSIRNYLG